MVTFGFNGPCGFMVRAGMMHEDHEAQSEVVVRYEVGPVDIQIGTIVDFDVACCILEPDDQGSARDAEAKVAAQLLDFSGCGPELRKAG